MANTRSRKPLASKEDVTEALVDILTGTATSDDFVVPGEAEDAGDVPVESVIATELADGIPFPGDTRPVREQVNDHEFLTVLSYIKRSGDDLFIAKWDYEWFDERDAAQEYADDMRAWAEEDVKANGDTLYAAALVETGAVLNVTSITVHGFVEDAWSNEMAQNIAKSPETMLFEPAEVKKAARKAPAKKAPAKKKTSTAVKGVVAKGNEPKVKARPRPVKKTQPESAAPKPVVRSRGFRKPPVAERKLNQNQKAG